MKNGHSRTSHTSKLTCEELEKMVFDQQNLLEISISLSSNLRFESLLESILYICIGQLVLDQIAIFLNVDLNSNKLELSKQWGYDLEENTVINEDSPIIEYLQEKEEIILKDEINKIICTDNSDDVINNLTPEIIIPLKSKNMLNGMIIIGERLIDTKSSVDEVSFLTYLGKFASIAVENSRLYQMAITDRMSGLYIHHYFHEKLLEEINRAERSNSKLFLLLLDIDYFKKVNDTYGHTTGDYIIQEISNIIHSKIRSFDIAARYGGEEFAVILPDVDEEEGFSIAERLRKAIEEYEFVFNENTLKITISIGISQFISNSKMTSADFINNTDSALYSAKRGGRNRTVFFGK